MTAVPVRIADAITAELNAALSAGKFTLTGWAPRRSYADWDEDYKDLSTIAVDVVFVTMGADNRVGLSSYTTQEYRQAVHVAVRKRFDIADRDDEGRLLNASVDPLINLVQEICDHFAELRLGDSLPTEVNASWLQSEVAQWVNQDLLRRGLFQGVVVLTLSIPVEV